MALGRSAPALSERFPRCCCCRYSFAESWPRKGSCARAKGLLAQLERCWLRSSLEVQQQPPSLSEIHHGAVNVLEGLTKTRHPAAKAVTQTPAKQEVTKKRSCNAGKPISICTNEEEDASLHKGASALAALQNGPTKKQRSAKGPRALPLRPISTCKRRGEATRAQSPAGARVIRVRGMPLGIELLAKCR